MHGIVKTSHVDEKSKEIQAAKRLQKIDDYIAARDLVWHKIKQDLYDLDGLRITRKVLEQNPDIYTFWNFRKKALQRFKELTEVRKPAEELPGENNQISEHCDFKEICHGEMELTENCLHKNPKSYGAWHHRFWVTKLLGKENVDFKAELKRCSDLLALDERNFHCWDYWRSICQLENVGADEQLAYCHAKITANFSNYSAWHCRSTLLPKVFPPILQENCTSFDVSVFKSELQLVLNAIFTDPEDQSAFFYRDWLIRQVRNQSHTVNLIKIQLLDQILTMLFDKHVTADLICRIKLCGSDELIFNACDFKWTAVDKSQCFTTWQCDDLKFVELKNQSMLTVDFGDESIEKFQCENNSTSGSNFQWISTSTLKIQPTNDFVMNSVRLDLVDLRKLVEMEPKEKWPLLSLVSSLRILDSNGYADEIQDGIQKLKLIDPLRRNYFEELTNRFRLDFK